MVTQEKYDRAVQLLNDLKSFCGNTLCQNCPFCYSEQCMFMQDSPNTLRKELLRTPEPPFSLSNRLCEQILAAEKEGKTVSHIDYSIDGMFSGTLDRKIIEQELERYKIALSSLLDGVEI